MSFEFVLCDVFTSAPFSGNQLAVFTDAEAIPEHLLQPIAREINFSETVFLYPPVAGGDVRARIFTPMAEWPFAGHPVLGTAAVVASEREHDLVRVETGSGVVPVAVKVQNDEIVGEMVQPFPKITAFAQAERLLTVLGVASSVLPVELYDNGMPHVFVALPGVDAVLSLRPDMNALALEFAKIGINCFGGSGTEWTTRMFAPGDGVPEDAATGSAAGPLGLHLVRHGRAEQGVTLMISQGECIGRPSTIFVTVDVNADTAMAIRVGGGSVIVGGGALTLK